MSKFEGEPTVELSPEEYLKKQIETGIIPPDAKIVQKGDHLTAVESSYTGEGEKPFYVAKEKFKKRSKDLPEENLTETSS